VIIWIMVQVRDLPLTYCISVIQKYT
jgi:predicted lipid carrier protein YhbT